MAREGSADGFAEGRLVDRYADFLLHLRDELRQHVLGEIIPQPLLDRLRLRGRRHVLRGSGVGDAEDHALRIAERGRARFADPCGKDLLHGVFRKLALRLSAREVLCLVPLHAGLLGERGEELASSEALRVVASERCEAIRDLVVAPVCGDLLADFVEFAVARRIDCGHVEPDVTVSLRAQGLIIDAHIRFEDFAHEPFAHRKIRDRLSVGAEAAGVHRRDFPNRETALGSDFGEGADGCALVLHLVVDRADPPARALQREFGADRVGDLLERLNALLLHIDDAHERSPEAPRDGSADLALRGGEGGLGNGAVHEIAAPERAEVQGVLCYPALRGEAFEVDLSGSETRRSGGRLLLGRKLDLLHVAALWRAELRIGDLLVARPRFLVADLRRVGDILRLDLQDDGRAVFRGAVAGDVLLEVLRQLLLAGSGNRLDRRFVEDDVFRSAALGTIAMDGRLRRDRNHDVARQCFDQLLTGQRGALFGDVALLGHVEVSQQVVEQVPVELPGLVLESRVLDDGARHELVGYVEAERAGALVEGGFGDEAGEDLVVEAEHARLLRRDLRAGPDRQLAELVLIGLARGLGADLRLADAGDRGGRPALEDVADPEHGKAENKEREQHPGESLADPGLTDVANTTKHERSSSLVL
ncbi:MAG TPA: hypothetical protein VLQ65_02395 [Saliniramus sp.]|nr:hypothetical protein [Saliniramus sp.]